MTNTVDMRSVMSAGDLQKLRKALGFTQAQMAAEMYLSKSAYVAIETEAANMRRGHQLKAERVAISELSHRADLAPILLALKPNDYLVETWSSGQALHNAGMR